jgi:hypothetical protein
MMPRLSACDIPCSRNRTDSTKDTFNGWVTYHLYRSFPIRYNYCSSFHILSIPPPPPHHQKAVAAEQKVDILKTRSVCCQPYLYIQQSNIYCSDVIWKKKYSISFRTSTECGLILIYIFMFCFTRSSKEKFFTHNFPGWNAGDLRYLEWK